MRICQKSLIIMMSKIIQKKKIPEFFPGDTIRVGVRIVEGKRERIQNFEGVCIAKKNRDINSSFTVRKISFGEGVERTFALYSPIVDTIKVVRSGKVRRAKLYYLRDRTGKSARIAEKIKKKIGIDIETKIQQVTEENVIPESGEKTEELPKAEANTPFGLYFDSVFKSKAYSPLAKYVLRGGAAANAWSVAFM